MEQNISPKAVYELPFKVTMENELRCFQYNVVHNILRTHSSLCNMKATLMTIYFTFYMNAPVFNLFGKG